MNILIYVIMFLYVNQTITKPFKGPLDYPSNEFIITLLGLVYDLPGESC